VDPLGLIPLATHAHRHRLDHGARGRLADAGWRRTCDTWDDGREQEVSGDRVNVIAWLEPPEGVVSALRTACPLCDQPRRGRGALRARVLRRQGHAGGPVLAAERTSRRRRAARGAGVRRRRGAWAATAPGRPTVHRTGRGVPLLWQRRADRRAPRLGHARDPAREAVGQRPAAHFSRPDWGESAIDKLLDASSSSARSLPDDPCSGRTHYTHRSHLGGIAPTSSRPTPRPR
jgi:hypothetical protein